MCELLASRRNHGGLRAFSHSTRRGVVSLVLVRPCSPLSMNHTEILKLSAGLQPAYSDGY
ncbi:unnamed protein product [Penicillium roqueforti FM164]|uniref:Genomic scaffold, ProqFM164S02 n=1 Tax=Penicillium roqueforti (strain FM164) TaxID=1365484 RepID=W6QC08_PENRF|nr:unnamed protein product [Penicillium roqueforti FM164]